MDSSNLRTQTAQRPRFRLVELAAVLALRNTLQHLKKNGSTNGWDEHLLPFSERQVEVDKAHFDAIEQKYAAAE